VPHSIWTLTSVTRLVHVGLSSWSSDHRATRVLQSLPVNSAQHHTTRWGTYLMCDVANNVIVYAYHTFILYTSHLLSMACHVSSVVALVGIVTVCIHGCSVYSSCKYLLTRVLILSHYCMYCRTRSGLQ
jgi:hypothetical protein